jgi:hypothetical protein
MILTRKYLGIMADSHDNLDMIRKAVDFFNEKQVSAVLHAGDLVSPFNVKGFTELEAPLHLVFGNNEGDRITIKEWFVKQGANVCGDFGTLDIEDLHIALLHGINEKEIEALAASGNFDLIVRGHTHQAGSHMIGNTRVINPGETAGVLTGKATVALVDPLTKETEIIEL